MSKSPQKRFMDYLVNMYLDGLHRAKHPPLVVTGGQKLDTSEIGPGKIVMLDEATEITEEQFKKFKTRQQ